MHFVHQSKQLSLLAVVFGSMICHSELTCIRSNLPEDNGCVCVSCKRSDGGQNILLHMRYWSCGVVRIFSEERDDEEKKVYCWALLQVK
jgi:hypothetical protein